MILKMCYCRVKGALVSKVNGELWELGRPLEVDCELHLLGFDTFEGKQVSSHVLSSFLKVALNFSGGQLCLKR